MLKVRPELKTTDHFEIYISLIFFLEVYVTFSFLVICLPYFNFHTFVNEKSLLQPPYFLLLSSPVSYS